MTIAIYIKDECMNQELIAQPDCPQSRWGVGCELTPTIGDLLPPMLSTNLKLKIFECLTLVFYMKPSTTKLWVIWYKIYFSGSFYLVILTNLHELRKLVKISL